MSLLAYFQNNKFAGVMLTMIRFIFLRTCVKRSGVSCLKHNKLILEDPVQGGNIHGSVDKDSFENPSIYWSGSGSETTLSTIGFKQYLGLFMLRHFLLSKLRDRKKELLAQKVTIDSQSKHVFYVQ